MRKKTIEQFKAELKEIQPDIKVLGEYINDSTKILVETKYGKCLSRANDLLQGKVPSIQSAIDKNAYFISQAKEVHGNKYDYSKVNYTKGQDKITIVCRKHGEFQQKAFKHLLGNGCVKCANEKMIGNNNASGTYNITLAERNKLEWSKIPAIVYFIKCWNDDEKFYKIGITVTSVKERFYGIRDMPYRYEVLREINTNLYDAVYLEKEMHTLHKEFQYKPKIKFAGYTECFIEIINE